MSDRGRHGRGVRVARGSDASRSRDAPRREVQRQGMRAPNGAGIGTLSGASLRKSWHEGSRKPPGLADNPRSAYRAQPPPPPNIGPQIATASALCRPLVDPTHRPRVGLGCACWGSSLQDVDCECRPWPASPKFGRLLPEPGPEINPNSAHVPNLSWNRAAPGWVHPP